MNTGTLTGLALDNGACSAAVPPDQCADQGSGLLIPCNVGDVELLCGIFYQPPLRAADVAANSGAVNGYFAAAQTAARNCFNDGPLHVPGSAQCIHDTFADSPDWNTPRAVLAFLAPTETEDPDVDRFDVAVRSQTGGIMIVYSEQEFRVATVGADGEQTEYTVWVFLLPPKRFRRQ